MSCHIWVELALSGRISNLDPPRQRRALGTRRRQRPPCGSKGCLESACVPAPQGAQAQDGLERRSEAVICGVSCPDGKMR